MDSLSSVGYIMTKDVVSVTPETPLVEAVDILVKNGYTGLPVVDAAKRVVGVLTEYDLIISSVSINLPLFLKLLQQFEVYKKDKSLISEDVEKILSMKVSEAMNKEPLVLRYNSTIAEAVRVFRDNHRVNPIPITDENAVLVGILSRFDLIKMFGVPAADVSTPASANPSQMDASMGKFLNNFEKNFILVSKTRTSHWWIYSLIFAIVGFLIAFAVILKLK